MKEQILLENKSNYQLHCLWCIFVVYFWCIFFYIDGVFLWCIFVVYFFYIDVIVLPSLHSDFESFIYDVVRWPSDSNYFINCVKLQPKYVLLTDM